MCFGRLVRMAAVLVIAVSMRNRRRRVWFRPAPRAACLEYCPASLAQFRQTKRSRSFLVLREYLLNRLLLFDAWQMKFREFKFRKDPDCPVCGENATIKELIDYEEFCGLRSQPQKPAGSARRNHGDGTATANGYVAATSR